MSRGTLQDDVKETDIGEQDDDSKALNTDDATDGSRKLVCSDSSIFPVEVEEGITASHDVHFYISSTSTRESSVCQSVTESPGDTINVSADDRPYQTNTTDEHSGTHNEVVKETSDKSDELSTRIEDKVNSDTVHLDSDELTVRNNVPEDPEASNRAAESHLANSHEVADEVEHLIQRHGAFSVNNDVLDRVQNVELDVDSGRCSPYDYDNGRSARAGDVDDDVIRHVSALQTTLLEHHEEEKIHSGLLELLLFCQVISEKLLSHLEQTEVNLHITSALLHFPSSLQIQQTGVHLMSLLATASNTLSCSMVKHNIHSWIVKVLTIFPGDSSIQEHALKLTSLLLTSDEFYSRLIVEDCNRDVMKVACAAVTNFPESVTIQLAASRAILKLVEDDAGQQDHWLTNVGFRLLDSLRTIADQSLLLEILRILKSIAKHAKHTEELVSRDLHVNLMELCCTSGAREEVVSECLHILCLLQNHDCVQSSLLHTGFVRNGLRQVLECHPRSHKIQGAGLRLIRPLVADLLLEKSQARDTSVMLTRLVYTVIFSYMDHPTLQEEGCSIISLILEHNPVASCWIGNSLDRHQYPIHNMCVGALLMYGRRETTYSCVCETIYWLAADNERICKALEGKNAHIAIISGLKQHYKHPRAVAAGCRSLRGLCIFLYDHKALLVQEGALSLLTKLQARYKSDVTVQIEVLSLIICLTDIEIVCYQCFVEKVPENIITTMTMFPDVCLMQETGLEAFAALSVADGGQDMLVNAGALKSTLLTLVQYPDNDLIQKKGMIVLQLFAVQAVGQPPPVRSQIADIIHSALKTFSTSKGVLTEACVALQLLAESDCEMSNLFVHNGCHQFLFSYLEQPYLGPGLESLAGECLYVLSQEQNLKSSMLLSACQSGMLPATECLVELGADFNTSCSSSNKTPLLMAVQHQQQDIVKLLLRYNIQDLLCPLRESLELGTDIITGLILQQLGNSRNDGVISWAGLDLQKLEASWIIIALTETLSKETDRYSSQVYKEKINHGGTRRKTRKNKLAYSRSDSAMRVHRVRIRHRSQEMSIDVARYQDELPKIERSKSRQLLSRSQSVEDSRRSQPTTPTTIPTSMSANTQAANIFTTDDVFEMSPTEEQNWRQNTITGANVSYNRQDPRQSPALSRKSSFDDKSPWIRKHSKPSLHYSSSSDESLKVPLQRKSSAPVISPAYVQPLIRKMSLGSKIAEIELVQHKTELSVTTTNLVLLDISDNQISDITCLCDLGLQGHLTHLEKFDVHSNLLTYLPENLYKNLPSLQTFDATYNAIATFPEGLLHCEKLKELNLSNNKIKSIKFTGKSQLKKLYLSQNEIQDLPDGLGNHLPVLKELLLDHNDILVLPQSPLGLKQLKMLDLSNNSVSQLPYEFLRLCERLVTLDLSCNQLRDDLAAELRNLSKIKLRNNSLAEKAPFCIPKFLLALPELKSLDISENKLTGLPPLSMWRSTNMRAFLANRNKIVQLPLHPPYIWANLEKLHLAYNNLKELPREIGQLTSLRSLDFSHNPGITSLPDELGRCNNLYEMPIDGLDLDLNRTLLNRRVKDIIGYLHNRLKKAQRYYRMKLMVVGFAERGKTTLLNTLMKSSNNKRENRPTVGVHVRDWKYTRFEKKHSDDMSGPRLFTHGRKVECTLNTWDFAGQEEFYSTHNCYLSNRAVYLVVFDLRRKVADVEKLKVWLTSLRSRAPGCPVIVVGTHLDKLAKDHGKLSEDKKKIGEKLREFNIKPGFPNITEVHLVDASCENETIAHLRNAILSVVHEFEIGKKRVMGEKIPASYVRLSELLTDMARRGLVPYPVIKHKELMKVVAEEQLDLDEEELQQAMTFLHESGVILHYDDTSLDLKDLYFIDPGWLCRMMAQVITVRQINPFVMDGILRKKDIQLLFNSKDSNFPNHLIPQYIKLLEKFEIALPHSDTELLIPSRLPTHRPEIHLPSQGKYDKILRIYRMPHVPIGLMYRLISRLLSLTSQKGFQLMLKLPKFPRKVFWRQGVFILWSVEAYFMVEYMAEDKSQSETINITVPASCQGSRLLGQIVDNLDNLIDEWYPGLTCIDPMMGQEILEILAPCSQCPTDSVSECHMFTIRELQTRATSDDYIKCPSHEANMLISELAPDLVLGDIEEEFQLDSKIFHFEESAGNRLGDGGFGDVFKGFYGDKEVAVKSFKEIGDVHPLTMLRQEATILRCLKHPSVVSLVAVGIQPCIILLELASHGTLASLIKQDRVLNKPLQQRIAVQVADGLDYLHGLMIVFRDMKPDNVLIFSTALDSEINAKISDYGISRFASLQGLKAQEGTLGYRAPEVIRKEIYSFSADIFSYGLTMYVMVARKHPFHKKESKGEMDRAIAEEEQIPEIAVSSVTTTALLDIQHLIMRCLIYAPSHRPSAKAVVQMLQRPEVLALQKMIPVSKTTTVECFAVEESGLSHTRAQQRRLWIASGDSFTYQLSFINLNDSTIKIQGRQFKHGRILCMQYLTEGHLALGTQQMKVWLYNTHTNKLVHSSARLQDSVLCMKVIPMEKHNQEGGLLFVGLANGKVAVFTVHDFMNEPNLDPVCLYPGEDSEPVLCMVRLGKRIFLSCGTKIVILNMAKGIGIAIDKIFETDPSRLLENSPIYTMAVQKGCIVFTRKGSPTVYIWDATKDKVTTSFNAGEVLRLPATEARITSLVADEQSIWIGTHSGHIGIIENKSLKVLAVTHRYLFSVRCLLKVKNLGGSSTATVFSGGLGNKYLDGSSGSMCGTVLVWDGRFPDIAKAASTYDSKRVVFKKQLDRQYYTGGEETE